MKKWVLSINVLDVSIHYQIKVRFQVFGNGVTIINTVLMDQGIDQETKRGVGLNEEPKEPNRASIYYIQTHIYHCYFCFYKILYSRIEIRMGGQHNL